MFFWLKKSVSFWLMPLPFCLTLLVMGLVLLWTRRARLGRGLLVTATLLLLAISNKYVSNLLVQPLETRYATIPELKADAPLPPALAACRFVVVLGSGHGNTEGLSATSKLSVSGLARITEGVRLLRRLPNAQLIASGGTEDARDPTHASILVQAAASLGIDPHRALVIEDARDTEEESLAVKRLVGRESFALVTSAAHMPRTLALFHHAGLYPVPCPTDFSSRPNAHPNLSDYSWDVESVVRTTWAVRERIGYLWIWLRGRGEP